MVPGLLALGTLVIVPTAKGVIDQLDQIDSTVDAAAAETQTALGVDQATIDAIEASASSMDPALGGGVLTRLVSGIGTLAGVASGVMLGALIRYYLVKDGTTVRRTPTGAQRALRPAGTNRGPRGACLYQGTLRLHEGPRGHREAEPALAGPTSDAATLGAQAGATVREMQSRLGQSTPNMALYHQGASAERDRGIADRLQAQVEVFEAGGSSRRAQ